MLRFFYSKTSCFFVMFAGTCRATGEREPRADSRTLRASSGAHRPVRVALRSSDTTAGRLRVLFTVAR